ncbi:hypothetical protein KKC94_05025 [Patescibacteria group bacterium]|nr:hypothetical protein [Patescibacteria group bacterium]
MDFAQYKHLLLTPKPTGVDDTLVLSTMVNVGEPEGLDINNMTDGFRAMIARTILEIGVVEKDGELALALANILRRNQQRLTARQSADERPDTTGTFRETIAHLRAMITDATSRLERMLAGLKMGDESLLTSVNFAPETTKLSQLMRFERARYAMDMAIAGYETAYSTAATSAKPTSTENAVLTEIPLLLNDPMRTRRILFETAQRTRREPDSPLLIHPVA